MIKQNYRDWTATMDKEKIAAIADRKVWIFILITFLVIIYASSHVGIAADFFQLQFLPTILCLAPVALCAAVVSSKRLLNTLPSEQFAVILMVTSATFQFFMWSLVCFSEMPGAAVMAALPILLAAYHGEFFLLSPRFLWGGLTTISAIIGALILAPDNDHRAIVIVGGIISLGAAFTMGGHARIHYQALRERDALKAAVDAQTLLDQVQEVEKTKDALYEIRGMNHDAGNALSGMLMNLDFLSNILKSDKISEQDIQEMRDMSDDLSEGSARLRQLIERGREAGKKAGDKEQVSVEKVMQDVINDARSTHPGINIGLSMELQSPNIKLHGGELALHRVLQNVVINACEGNGKHQSSQVELLVSETTSEVIFQVKDDGPGFDEQQLQQTTAHFKTTKESGTGLGLYTSQRLISANRGELQYSNNPDRGACVEITLPR